MLFRIDKKRGGPIFVRRRGEVISLVPEVRTLVVRVGSSSIRLKLPGSHSDYVIDSEGVKRVRRRNAGAWVWVLLISTALLIAKRVLRNR